MPPISFHIQHPWFAIGIKHHTLSFIAIVIIEYPLNLSAQYHHSFRRCVMPMNRHYSSRLKGIKHSLALVIRAVT